MHDVACEFACAVAMRSSNGGKRLNGITEILFLAIFKLTISYYCYYYYYYCYLNSSQVLNKFYIIIIIYFS